MYRTSSGAAARAVAACRDHQPNRHCDTTGAVGGLGPAPPRAHYRAARNCRCRVCRPSPPVVDDRAAPVRRT